MISYSQLEQFGLTDKEAKVYLAALKLGISGVQDIGKAANIHRVSTYDILEILKEKGFVHQSIKNNKRFIMATEPEHVLEILKNKEKIFSGLMPELKAIQGKEGKRPKVMYFEGRDEVWKAHLDRIKHKPELKENLVYGSSEKLLTIYPNEFKKELKERLKKGIKSKIIIEKSKFGLLQAKTAKEQLREVKFIPEGETFKSNTIIYGDRVLTISWENMIAVIVEDKENAENQRFVFNLLWKYLP